MGRYPNSRLRRTITESRQEHEFGSKIDDFSSNALAGDAPASCTIVDDGRGRFRSSERASRLAIDRLRSRSASKLVDLFGKTLDIELRSETTIAAPARAMAMAFFIWCSSVWSDRELNRRPPDGAHFRERGRARRAITNEAEV